MSKRDDGQIIRASDETWLVPELSKDEWQVRFFWNVMGTSLLAKAANQVDRGKTKHAVVAVVLDLPDEGLLEDDLYLHLFVNLTLTDTALRQATTRVEAKTLKGLATQTLCWLLRHYCGSKDIRMTDEIRLSATSLSTGADAVGKVHPGLLRHYLSLGFEFSAPDTVEKSIKKNNVRMKSRVARVLSNCSRVYNWSK